MNLRREYLMMINPYFSEARAVPQSYGSMTGNATPMGTMPMMNSPKPQPGMTGGQFLPSMTSVPGAGTVAQSGPFEESYIENILRLNLGKTATIYMTFENNSEWNAKIFKGVLEAAGRDHIIISDPQTGMRYLLLMVNLDYITFDEPLNYSYPVRTPSYVYG
jgi:spore germination protein Q